MKRLKIIPLILAIALNLQCNSIAEEFSPEYNKRVLDNGAAIVSRYVPDSPIVTIQIRVLSGLSNEGKYAGTGISHFLEHLLFKGTGGMSSEEIRSRTKAMGGIVNGATGLDSAEYHITVPNAYYKEALGLLADMVMDPVFTDREFDTEKEIILKEIKLRNDDPSTRRIRLLFSQAYRENVYRYPVIGYEELFRELTKDDVERYHRAVYTPDRMVVGIAGGVPAPEALAAGEDKFREYLRGRATGDAVTIEPAQIDENVSSFEEDITLGYIAVGFHTTSLYSPELYPGDVLSILLGEGDDSRLYRELVKDEQLLYSVSSMNYTPKYPGLFVVTGIGPAEKMDEARERIFAVIETLKSKTVETGEFERARTTVVSRYLHSHEKIDSVVSSMTTSQMLTGDPAFFEKYVEEIDKVDPDEAMDFASKYLDKDNSTTVVLLPAGYLKENTDTKSPSTEKEYSKKLTLDNGMRVMVEKRSGVPLVAATLVVSGGLRAEDAENNGISNLTASLLLKGTKTRSEKEIIPVIEMSGGTIGSFSGFNSIGISMDLMKDELEEGLNILEDVVINSNFPEQEISKQKKKIIAAIAEEEKDIFSKGLINLKKMLYEKHPYSMRIKGDADTVASLARADIIEFYKKRFSPEGAVLTVVGDLDVEKTLSVIAKRFSSWQGRRQELKDIKVDPVSGALEENISMRKEQALLLFGVQGVKADDDRKYALDVISSLLSGSDGLLFSVAREKEGLTYTSGAFSSPEVDRGFFVVYVATTENKLEKAGKTVSRVINIIRRGGMSEEDIASSKSSLITQHAYSIESNSAITMRASIDELAGLGFEDHKLYSDRINSVERDDIIAAAEDILDPEKSATVIVHSE